jgi:hypothetical protein
MHKGMIVKGQHQGLSVRINLQCGYPFLKEGTTCTITEGSKKGTIVVLRDDEVQWNNNLKWGR